MVAIPAREAVQDGSRDLMPRPVDFFGQVSNGWGDPDRITGSVLDLAQWIGKLRQLKGGMFARRGQGNGKRQAAAFLHDRPDQCLALVRVVLQSQDIFGHPAVRAIASIDLLPSGPGALSLRAFSARASREFLKFVSAIQVRSV